MIVLVLLVYSMAIVYCSYYDDSVDSSDYETVETNLTRAKKDFMGRVKNMCDTLDELWQRVSYVNIHVLGADVGRMGDPILRQVHQRLHSYNYSDTYLQTNYNCSDKDIKAIQDWHSKSIQLSDKLKLLFMNLKSQIIE